MSDISTVRCPACRGRKKVEKLGGILGDCNTCAGSGAIESKPLCAPAVEIADSITKGNRTIYKRKAKG